MLRVHLFTEVAQRYHFERRALMQGYVDCHCHISASNFDKVWLTVLHVTKDAGEYFDLT